MSDTPIRSRQYRHRADWQNLVDQWQASGESVSVFCSRNKIGESSFYKWRQQLVQGVQPTQTPGFLDLSGLSVSGSSPWRIVLKLGDGVELELNRG